MKLKDSYDWVVLSEQVGALLSGALAARLGLSVLIVPISNPMDAHVSRSGQVLDPDPGFLLGFEEGREGKQGGLLRECLIMAGATQSELEIFRPSGVSAELMNPGMRVRAYSDESALIRELNREMGKTPVDGKRVQAVMERSRALGEDFWKSLPQRLTLDLTERKKKKPKSVTGWADLRRSLVKLERDWHGTLPEELTHALFSALSGGGGNAKPGPELLHLLGARSGGVRVRGGMTAFRNLLLRLAVRQGAHHLPKTECRRLFISQGRWIGLQLASRGSVIASKGAAMGCVLDHGAELISEERSVFWGKLRSAPRPSAWRMTLGLTINEEAIPPGSSWRWLWKESASPTFEVELADPADYGVSAPGKKLMFCRTALPFEQESLSSEYQRTVLSRMMRQLCEWIPDLEYHVSKVYPDFREGTREIEEAFGFATPSLIPDNLRIYDVDGLGSRSGVEGVFLTNGEAYPKLGTLGPMLSALESTAWVAHRSGLPGPWV